MARHQTDYDKCSKSRLLCPFCKDELNMKYEGFTCYGAVDGPYMKGRIALECSSQKCTYRHEVLFNASDGETIHRMEKTMARIVTHLPKIGYRAVLARAKPALPG